MNRRQFVSLAAAPFALARGSVLVHEHILVDFTGGGRYDREEVVRLARPKLEEVRALGCARFQDCTPNFVGRDVRLIASLARLTGMEIWTNTGLYAAANQKYLPDYARAETAEQLARRWIDEFRKGIDGVKPRFVKIGVNRAPLPEVERKLARAAAIASRETGLTVASHTGDGAAALEQIDIIEPRRFVWVHAQSEKDHAIHEKVARAGAWVEFDGINPKTVDWHRECLEFMAGRKLLGRTLISQDSGWYHVGEPGGGDFRGYSYLHTDFLPRLPADWVPTLMVENPRKAFG